MKVKFHDKHRAEFVLTKEEFLYLTGQARIPIMYAISIALTSETFEMLIEFDDQINDPVEGIFLFASPDNDLHGINISVGSDNWKDILCEIGTEYRKPPMSTG